MVITLFFSYLSMLMNFYFSGCCEGFSPFATAVFAVVGVNDLPPKALTIILLVWAVNVFHNIFTTAFWTYRHVNTPQKKELEVC